MKWRHSIDNKIEESEVHITTNDSNKDDFIKVQKCFTTRMSFKGKDHLGRNHIFNLDDVIYFEVIDKKCYVYVAEMFLELELSFKQVSHAIKDINYLVQINKYTIINVQYIDYFKTLVNAKIQVILKNDYRSVVNRTYLKEFKDTLKEVYYHD